MAKNVTGRQYHEGCYMQIEEPFPILGDERCNVACIKEKCRVETLILARESFSQDEGPETKKHRNDIFGDVFQLKMIITNTTG